MGAWFKEHGGVVEFPPNNEFVDITLEDPVLGLTVTIVKIHLGEKLLCFRGDFRQILPIVQNGSQSDIVNASLSSSHILSKCKVRLTVGCQAIDLEETNRSVEWLLELGEGKLGDHNDDNDIIDIPDDLLIGDSSDPISDLIDFAYPSLLKNFNDISYF
ncbi:uncharacterized protein LOC143537608 [Bidens hawaiensis]|uniref:uncharacterized protein LOC143537608 n=1 Tax=Bidens hawaiensis TaxID=980011 RepID=UPI00404B7D77